MNSTLRLAAIFCAAALSVFSSERIPLPVPFSMSGIAYGDGMFVAVSYSGSIITSSDTTEWDLQQSFPNYYFSTVTHAGGLFVAAGGPDAIVTSSNGIDWVAQQLEGGSGAELSGLAHGNGTFIAVGEFSIWSSTDAMDWTQEMLAPDPQALEDVAFGNGIFVAVGMNGSIVTSADGKNWVNQNSGIGSDLTSVTFGAGRFAVISNDGQALTSTDGLAWTARPTGIYELLSVNYGGDLFIAMGHQGRLATAPDAITWCPRNSGSASNFLRDMAYGNGTYVVVGSRTILTSSDGAQWLDIATLPTAPFITQQPQNTSAVAGYPAYFGVVASGNPTPAYQWRFNDTIVGTTDFVELPAVRTNDAGAYTVVVYNYLGSVTSLVATLTVTTAPPTILSEPEDQTAYAGLGAFAIEVPVAGSLPLFYQWEFNGALLPSQTNAALSFNPVTLDHAGEYRVVITNDFGSVTSRTVMLTVLIQPPSATSLSQNQTVAAGSHVLFSASVQGSPPLHRQWQLNGTNIPGAHSRVLHLFKAAPHQSGAYSLFVSNSAGSVTGAVATLTVTPATSLDRWHWRAPVPQGNDLDTVVFGNGLFVAAGEYGTILTSTDGTNWTEGGLNADIDIRGLAFGNGRFVALTTSPLVLTSTNAIDWSAHEVPYPMSGITYGDGVFVTVTYGSILYSTDGITWMQAVTDVYPELTAVTFGKGLFVAVGLTTMTSSDGAEWSVSNFDPDTLFRSIAYADGSFIALGHSSELGGNFVFRSAAGATWSPIIPAMNGGAVTFGGGRVVAIGNGFSPFDPTSYALASSGGGWTFEHISGVEFPRAVAYGNGVFVVVGDFGNLATSPTGSAWQKRSESSSNNLRASAYGNGRFLAVGNGGTNLTSADGIDWTSGELLTTNNLHEAVFAEDLFVAVGNAGTVLTSPNGSDWTLQSVIETDLVGITYGAGRFVAVGDQGAIVSSEDLTNWTATVSGSLNFEGVVYGNGIYVAVGQNGRITTSSDATTWVIRPSGVGWDFLGIAYGNARFVVVGDRRNTILTSLNGTNWTALTPGPFRSLDEVIFADNRFIAVGEDGFILSSTSGTSWMRRTTPTATRLRGIAFGEGSFVVAGNNSIILQSGSSAAQLNLLPRLGGTQLRLTGEPGRQYRIQSSPELSGATWTDTLSVTLSESSTNILDSTDTPRRFYRAITP